MGIEMLPTPQNIMLVAYKYDYYRKYLAFMSCVVYGEAVKKASRVVKRNALRKPLTDKRMVAIFR
jgi:hypothetical protein